MTMRNRGFTLPELIITVVIGSILAAVAVPAFQDFIRDNRIVTQTNEFITDLYFARTEAVKRNRRVTICKSANPLAAEPVCNLSADLNWSIGWVVFVDSTPNGQRTNDETVLRVHEALDGNLLLYPRQADTNIAQYVSYTPRGITQIIGGGTQNGIFRMCDARGLTSARAITVAQTGRVSATPPSDSAALVGSCPPP